MQIAVTSQNRRTITEHAGKCRKFWIYDVDQGRIAGKRLVELPLEQSFHASHGQLAGPLAGINVLITASMGAGLQQRLKQNGIQPVITVEENPDSAVAALLANELLYCAPGHAHQCGENCQHH
jgi:predicted Fe-Mo cluster-binding NifX family protein